MARWQQEVERNYTGKGHNALPADPIQEQPGAVAPIAPPVRKCQSGFPVPVATGTFLA
jgi:hypothetical protein